MITEAQQEQASLYALGALTDAEARAFEAELRANAELQELVRGLQRTADAMAVSGAQAALPAGLKQKVLGRIDELAGARVSASKLTAAGGLAFVTAKDLAGWKALPIPGAYIKLLSLEKERGYAVLLGKLDPGARYPAHVNTGPEDFCVLTGDLHIGDRELGPGDFHHADKGSQHVENFSVGGCTLLAVLTTDDPLVAFAAG